MVINRRLARATVAALGLLLLLSPPATGAAPAQAAPSALADSAFDRVWCHCDKPVQDGVTARSWMWGPSGFYTTYEPYAEGPGGVHLVTYFDKSRMEINDPDADRNSEWFVTNGLLVVDMIAGRVQTGNNSYAPALPANIPVAGDTATSVHAPTYATLARVASVNADRRAPNRVGQPVRELLDRAGNVGTINDLAGLTYEAVYEPVLGHNIPAVFWDFMNRKGVVYKNGTYVPDEVLVDWLFAMGYPITDPYWIQINVGGQSRWVLMQAFQRRILTYSPDNPAGWQVEMGNVGRAYFNWRYPGAAPAPTAAPTATPVPTPVPRHASIALSPASGTLNTRITISGKNFPAYAGVSLSVEQSAAQYKHGLTTLAAKGDGSFSVAISLPADVARYTEVTLVATANGGSIRATQVFRLTYDPALTVSSSTVLSNGTVPVHGTGFPPGTSIRLGLALPHGQVDWRTGVQAAGDGTFNLDLAIGSRDAGTQFHVLAMLEDGRKITSGTTVTVIATPTLQVSPPSGGTGLYVAVRGTGWPPNSTLGVGVRVATSQAVAWEVEPYTSDSAGNCGMALWIGDEYAKAQELRLIVTAPNGIRVEAPYYITQAPLPTPTPAGLRVSAEPNTVAAGQTVRITGTHWPAGATLSIGLGRPAVEEWVATPLVNAQGNFATSFIVANHWQNAGPLTLTAVAPDGRSATTPLYVVDRPGRIVPGGVPITVAVVTLQDGSVSIRLTSAGWRQSSAVTVSVISADAAVNAPIMTVPIGADRVLRATFPATAAWWARSDLGVRAVSTDGQQSALAYLPWALKTRADGGNNYLLRGANWPANHTFTVRLNLGGDDEQTVGRGVTDANGTFQLVVALPRLPTSGKNDLEVEMDGEQYCAWFAL